MTQELDTLSEVSRITNAELVCRLERLVKADRALSVKLLVHLGEVDARKLYCEHGYESMHKYCVTALRMSDAEAYLRIQAARLGRRFPLVLERIGAGDLSAATVDNLRLACRAHNLFLAYQDYGRRFMQGKLREAVQKKGARSSVQGRAES